MLDKLEVHSISIMDALYMEYTQVHSTQLFNALCKEFNLKKLQFLQVKNEYKSLDKVFLVDYKKESQTDFKLVAIKLFFYDFAKETVTKEDYVTRIIKIVNKAFPQFEDSEYVIDVKKATNGEFSLETVYWYIKGMLEEDFSDSYDISYVPIKSLNQKLESFLEIPDFEADKMCQKYIKKQIKNYLTYLKKDGDSLEDLIRPVEYNLRAYLLGEDNNFNIQAYKFGYTIHKHLEECDYGFLIKETIVQEIKAVLEENLYGYMISEMTSLGTNQIMRLASIEDFESFHKRVLRSCVEYCYYKEIANTNREFVLDELFSREQTVKTEVIEKEAPVDEKLLAQIEQLKKENESLKEKLLDSQKESDRILKEKEKQFQTQLSDKEKSINNAKLLLRMWGAFCGVLLDGLNNDDTQIFDYDLEYMQKKKIMFIGGRDEVKRELRKLFPKATFVESETGKLQSIDVDMVFFFTNYMNHSMFFKYISKLRTNKISYGFSVSTNTEKILSDMYSWFIGRKELINIEG